MTGMRGDGRGCTLVLGGGGVRGIAHVGVLRALHERGVVIDEIVGTSIGAIVGGAAAAGVDWQALTERAARFTKDDIVLVNRWALLLNGIRQTSVFQADKLHEFIREVVPAQDWSDLRVPLSVNAVDAQTARVEWFGAGGRLEVPLHDAIYASAALPMYYPPAEFAGRYYFDGGILAPLPIERAVERGARRIIAVDLSTELKEDAGAEIAKGLIGVHHRVLSVVRAHTRQLELEAAPVCPLLLIRPQLGDYGTWDFDQVTTFLDEGYRAATEALDDEQEALSA